MFLFQQVNLFKNVFFSLIVWQTQTTTGARLVTVPVNSVRPTASSIVAANQQGIRIARRPATTATTVLMPIGTRAQQQNNSNIQIVQQQTAQQQPQILVTAVDTVNNVETTMQIDSSSLNTSNTESQQ